LAGALAAKPGLHIALGDTFMSKKHPDRWLKESRLAPCAGPVIRGSVVPWFRGSVVDFTEYLSVTVTCALAQDRA